MQAQDDDRRQKKAKEAPRKLPTVSLTLVSFAVTRKAYERITQRFAADYEARTGQAVRFRLSFGGSGTQVRRTRACRSTSRHTHRLLDACVEVLHARCARPSSTWRSASQPSMV